jgi:hypothetical protein
MMEICGCAVLGHVSNRHQSLHPCSEQCKGRIGTGAATGGGVLRAERARWSLSPTRRARGLKAFTNRWPVCRIPTRSPPARAPSLLRCPQGRRASPGVGPDRTAGLIRYAISDSAPTLRVGAHPARAHSGRGSNRVLDPCAEPWRPGMSERACAGVVGGTGGGSIPCAGHGSPAARSTVAPSPERRAHAPVVASGSSRTAGKPASRCSPKSVPRICHCPHVTSPQSKQKYRAGRLRSRKHHRSARRKTSLPSAFGCANPRLATAFTGPQQRQSATPKPAPSVHPATHARAAAAAGPACAPMRWLHRQRAQAGGRLAWTGGPRLPARPCRNHGRTRCPAAPALPGAPAPSTRSPPPRGRPCSAPASRRRAAPWGRGTIHLCPTPASWRPAISGSRSSSSPSSSGSSPW